MLAAHCYVSYGGWHDRLFLPCMVVGTTGICKWLVASGARFTAGTQHDNLAPIVLLYRSSNTPQHGMRGMGTEGRLQVTKLLS